MNLPFRGLGLSSNLDALQRPRPYAMLDAHPGCFDFLEYSAPLNLDRARLDASLFATMDSRRDSTPVLFHPVHLNLYGPRFEPPDALAALDAHARAVGSAWVGNDVGWWHHDGAAFPGYLYVAPPFSHAGIEDCVAHARHVQSHLSVPLVLENPAVLRQNGPLHVLEFMAALHERTGFPLLLDLGHLWSFQLAARLPTKAAWDRFPFDAVAEIHIAGGVVTEREGRTFYVDDHTQPVREELFAMLAELRPLCRNLRALTFEGEGHPERLAERTLARLRPCAPPASRIAGPSTSRSSLALPSQTTDPWTLFDEVYGRSQAVPSDALGTVVEQDFRLAVIAEQLDSRFPLTRLCVAPDREGLLEFTKSDLFRSVFAAGGGPTMEGAFARHARGKAIRDPGLAAILAFETWVQSLFRAPTPASERLPPQLTLAPGVRAGTFPSSLEEVVFAAKALRRHVTQRAFGSGLLETSGASVLRSAADRAPMVPWRIAARTRGTVLEVFTLPSTSADPADWNEAVRAGFVIRRLSED